MRRRWSKVQTGRIDLGITGNLNMMMCLSEQIRHLEKIMKAQVKIKPAFELLLLVPGIYVFWVYRSCSQPVISVVFPVSGTLLLTAAV